MLITSAYIYGLWTDRVDVAKEMYEWDDSAKNKNNSNIGSKSVVTRVSLYGLRTQMHNVIYASCNESSAMVRNNSQIHFFFLIKTKNRRTCRARQEDENQTSDIERKQSRMSPWGGAKSHFMCEVEWVKWVGMVRAHGFPGHLDWLWCLSKKKNK